MKLKPQIKFNELFKLMKKMKIISHLQKMNNNFGHNNIIKKRSKIFLIFHKTIFHKKIKKKKRKVIH